MTYFTARSILETGFFMGKNVKMKCYGNYCGLRPETWQMQTTYEVSKGIIIIIMTLFKEEAQLDKSNLP